MSVVSISKSGRITTVSFNRAGKANALSLTVMRELTDVARSFESDADISAIILTGRADTFSLGFDLKDPATLALRNLPLSEQRVHLATGARMCAAWEALAPLTISCIEGYCMGGGVALAVSTDLRIVSETAQIAVPEIERGLNMSWGSVPRITNLVGPARAKRMILLSEVIDGQTALDWGLADRLVAPFQTLGAAQEWANRAAKMPPVPLRMGKSSINAYANALAQTASHADADQFALALASDDGLEGMTSFLEARDATFTGR